MDEASKSILSQLLSEFCERSLSATDLRKTYKGLPPKELKERCVTEGIGEVGYDLAISDLEKKGLVGTGPRAMRDNPPGSMVIFIGTYSKREYSYLTENGYREAVKIASTQEARSSPKSFPERSRAVIHGDQIINYGQVGAIGQNSVGTVNTFNQCWQRIETDIDLGKLASELGTLRIELLKSAATSEDYVQVGMLAQAECEAKSSNGPGVMKTLSSAARAVLETAERIGTDIAAKVIVEAAKGY
jgi:hypothetical protein